MSANKSHHYVPQYYFRNFNGGTNAICLLLTKDGRVRLRASIKGQCAKNQLYGNPAIEKAFADLEGIHVASIRALIKAGDSGEFSSWKNDMLPSLLQAVLFQRARTILEFEKQNAAHEQMMMYWFMEELRRKLPPNEVDEAIANLADAKIVQNQTEAVLHQIKMAFQFAALLVDLQPRMIRNHTKCPFIFSDSPVVFYNSYYRRITDRGVLGLTTPGLQIFLPLSPTLQLMLFDSEVYKGDCLKGPFVEAANTQDVEQLNALQMHHSREAIYFANPDDERNVKHLYDTYKATIVRPQAVARVRHDLLVRGEPGHEIMHTYEPQLAHELALTFVICQPIEPSEFYFRRRSPELVDEHRKIHPELYGDEEEECDSGRISPESKVTVPVQRSQGNSSSIFPKPRTHGPLRESVRRQHVGRNDPCPCGSGRKFKRCCHP